MVMVRRLGVPSLLVICSVLPTAAQELAAPSTTVTVAGVRPSSPQLKALIDDGVARSKTFTNLVRAIEATDGIVFVEEGRCPSAVAACLEWRVRLAGSYRILFVRIAS